MNNCCSPYGNFRTRTFANIFTPLTQDIEEGRVNNADVFKYKITETKIPVKIKNENLIILFYLLYGKYGNSHISSSDENTFIYKLSSIIFMYGPTWEKRLEIQDKLRALQEEDLLKGGSAIYNSANAPGTIISDITDSDGKVNFLSAQNTTAYKKSKLEGYSILIDLLKTDVTKEFIDKFENLFIKIVEPYYPLWYETEKEE